MIEKKKITILGGGPAGLSVGYYCKKNEIPFTIYESSNSVGGVCRTLRHGDFLYDTGAHRFHDKSEKATTVVKELLGDDLVSINVPSYIYCDNKFIDFPLLPLNLIKKIGIFKFLKCGIEFVLARFDKSVVTNFEKFAIQSYGRTIADKFLLQYSEKLWGMPCSELSLSIAGTRIKGLNVKVFLKEFINGNSVKTAHLDGSFYYPKYGFGQISDKLSGFCGGENIRLNACVTRINHRENNIYSVEINGKEIVEVDELVSSLPLDLFLKYLNPSPPEEIKKLSSQIKYRDLVLVTLFINKPSVIEAGTIYISDRKVPITRIYEPKNRSKLMSPEGKTSLVAEIPFNKETMKNFDDKDFIEIVTDYLCKHRFVERSEIEDVLVKKINYAYPILDLGYEEKITKINTYLNQFTNLKLTGRNGKFVYSWLHDMLDYGRTIVEEYVNDSSGA